MEIGSRTSIKTSSDTCACYNGSRTATASWTAIMQSLQPTAPSQVLKTEPLPGALPNYENVTA